MGDSDWVEIYFDGVNTSLYQLMDSLDTSPKSLSTANCNENFCTIDWSSRLNNSGDTIRLVATSSGEIIDQIGYGNSGDILAPNSGQSAGRRINGEGEWVIFSSPTKGSSNNSSTPISTPTTTLTPSDTPAQTLTPTQTPILTKTPTPTKKPTAIPTKIPSNKPTPTPSESAKVNLPESILGAATKSADPSPTPTTDENNTFSFKNLVFVAGGIILILAGVLVFTFVAKERFKKI